MTTTFLRFNIIVCSAANATTVSACTRKLISLHLHIVFERSLYDTRFIRNYSFFFVFRNVCYFISLQLLLYSVGVCCSYIDMSSDFFDSEWVYCTNFVYTRMHLLSFQKIRYVGNKYSKISGPHMKYSTRIDVSFATNSIIWNDFISSYSLRIT